MVAILVGLTFRQEARAPAWDPSVETWDAMDGGKVIGRFYLDMHPRPGKFSHAEMVPAVDGVRGKQLPEAVLVCNFPKPAAGDAGLMEYGDVVTFFHEFGHLMHWIWGRQTGRHQRVTGIDFVKSAFADAGEWMRSPQVLAKSRGITRLLPSARTALRMNRASAFGRGSWVSQQNAYTAISYDIYKGKPQDVDLDAVTTGDLKRYSHTVPLTGTHLYASFGHLAGYSSAYYTYLWDKVIAEDFFEQFDSANLLGGPAPMRYRRAVLEPGGSVPANDLVKNFLGRPQNMTAFQKWMAEEFEGGKN